MRWILAALPPLSVAALCVAACSSSGGAGESCDFGAGGMTAALCDGYASRASCASHTLADQVEAPCADNAGVTLTVHCCDLTQCSGDLSFLSTPDAAFAFPAPTWDCDAGGDAAGGDGNAADSAGEGASQGSDGAAGHEGAAGSDGGEAGAG